MYKTIELGGKPLELQSNAATPRVYRSIFNRDLFKDFTAIDTEALGAGSSLETLDLIKRLAFTLNIQATREFRSYYGKLSEVDFVEWLSQYEDEEFYDSEKLIDIIAVWQKSAKTSSEAKNQVSPQ